MSITVATQDSLSTLIRERVGKRIEQIKAGERVNMEQLRKQAREQLLAEQGVSADAARYDFLKAQIAEMQAEAERLNKKLKDIFGKPANYYRDDWTDSFQAAVAARTDALFLQSETGKQVAELEKAPSDMQMIVLTATSPKELKGLIQKINELVAYEPSAMEKVFLDAAQ